MKYSLVCLILFLTTLSFSQEKFTISGTISQNSSGEGMIGVRVVVKDLQGVGSISNEYGFYSIEVPAGTHKVQISYLGYATQEETITFQSSIRKNFSLVESSQMLEEVILTEEVRRIDVRKPEMSVNKLSTKEIKELPVVLGEADVIRSILTLPGVTNAGEGQSGFNVRGGAADQNLILLDEATIYN